MPTILRNKHVREKTKLSRSTLNLLVKKGEFPSGFPLGDRAVGWLESDVDAWIASRAAASRQLTPEAHLNPADQARPQPAAKVRRLPAGTAKAPKQSDT